MNPVQYKINMKRALYFVENRIIRLGKSRNEVQPGPAAVLTIDN